MPPVTQIDGSWYYQSPTNGTQWLGPYPTQNAAVAAALAAVGAGSASGGTGTGTGGSGGGTQQTQQTDPQITALQDQVAALAQATAAQAIAAAAEQKRQWEMQYALSQNADDRAYAQLQINQATAKLAQLQFAESQRQFNASTGLSLLSTAAQLQRPSDWFKYQQYTQGGKNLAAQLSGAPNPDFQAPVGTTRAAGLQDIMNDLGLGNIGGGTGGGGAMPALPDVPSTGPQRNSQQSAPVAQSAPAAQQQAAAATTTGGALAHPGITQIMGGGAASANPMLDAAVAAILAGRSLTPEESKALMAKPGGDISGAPGIDSSTSQADRKTLQTGYQSAIDQQNGKSESPGEWVNRTQLPNRLSSNPLAGGYIMNPQTGQYVEANNQYAPDLPGSTEDWFGKGLAEQYAAMQQKWNAGDFKHMGWQRKFWFSHGAILDSNTGAIYWDPSREGQQGGWSGAKPAKPGEPDGPTNLGIPGQNASASSNGGTGGTTMMTTNANGQRDSRSPLDATNPTRFAGWSTTPTPSNVVSGYTTPAKQQSQGKDPGAWTFNQTWQKFTRNDDGIVKKLRPGAYVDKFGALPDNFDLSLLRPDQLWELANYDKMKGPAGVFKKKWYVNAPMPQGWTADQAFMDALRARTIRAGGTGVAGGTPVQGAAGGIPLPAGNASGLSSIPYAHQLNPAVYDKLGATGQALLQGAAQAAGWDWNDYQNQLNAARPKGTAARQTYTQRSADNLAMY